MKKNENQYKEYDECQVYGDVVVVFNVVEQSYCMRDLNGNVLVSKRRYNWIGAFDGGLARVHDRYIDVDSVNMTGFKKWGIINDKGEELLPAEYDEITDFVGKGLSEIKAVKDGVEVIISLDALRGNEDNMDNNGDEDMDRVDADDE